MPTPIWVLLAALAAVIGFAATKTVRNVLRRRPGDPATFERLCSKVPLEITNDEEFFVASRMVRRLRERDLLPGNDRIDAQEFRYLQELRISVAIYIQQRPHLDYGLEWLRERREQLVQIYVAVDSVRRSVASWKERPPVVMIEILICQKQADAALAMIAGRCRPANPAELKALAQKLKDLPKTLSRVAREAEGIYRDVRNGNRLTNCA